MSRVCGGDTVQVMHPARRKCTQNTCGGYSEDARIRAGDNGGSVRVLPDLPVAQRDAIDRRSPGADLGPAQCDWSAGCGRRSLAEVLAGTGPSLETAPSCR